MCERKRESKREMEVNKRDRERSVYVSEREKVRERTREVRARGS